MIKVKFVYHALLLTLPIIWVSCNKEPLDKDPPLTHPIPILDSIIDPRDGNVYQTVQIGDQTWMAENLRYFHSSAHGYSGRYGWSNPSKPNIKYGWLYNWDAVMNGADSSSANPSGVQGICPPGWHVPSDAEWTELEVTLGMPQSNINERGGRGLHGLVMKSISGWDNNSNGTNSSKFNILPTGIRSTFGTREKYRYLGSHASFWSCTEFNDPSFLTGYTNVWIRFFAPNHGVTRVPAPPDVSDGRACRCVKD